METKNEQNLDQNLTPKGLDLNTLKRLRELETEVNSLRATNKRIKIVNNSLVDKIDKLTIEHEKFRKRIAELNRKIGSYESKLNKNK